MNDLEFEFKQDIKEKKSTANGARHRKRGSKTKYVSLPSDGMTRKQWEKKNGEVFSVKMNQPLSWDVFCTLPESLQTEYLNHLIQEHGANRARFAEMFGVHPTTLDKHIQRKQLDVKFIRTAKNRKKQAEQWDRFISGVMEAPAEMNTDCEKNFHPSSLSVTFRGEIDLDGVLSFLQAVVGEAPEGELQIMFSKGGSHI